MRNICAFDGKAFEASRADARYCSAACRAKASKARRREGAEMVVQPAAVPPESPMVKESLSAPIEREDARIDALEQRLADLEDDFDLAEVRENEKSVDKRLLEIVRRELNAVLVPVLQRLQAIEALGAWLRDAIDRTTRELAVQRVPPVEESGRIDEIEQAVITLAHQFHALRSDLDTFTAGIAAIETDGTTVQGRARHR